MKIFGKNHRGPVYTTAAPRKRTKPTKAEARLKLRVRSYNTTISENKMGPELRGYRRPGSLKKA